MVDGRMKIILTDQITLLMERHLNIVGLKIIIPKNYEGKFD